MDDDEDRLAAWRGVLLAHARALSAIEADMAREQQIAMAWYDVLLELNAAPDRRLRMSELGDKVVLSRTRVSRVVDELQAAGHVVRQPSEDDRRVTWAVVTPAGRDALRRAAPSYLASIERHFTSLLTDSDRRAVARALRKVVVHHDAAGAAGAPR